MSTNDHEAAEHPERVEREIEDGLKSCRAVVRNYRKHLADVYGEHRMAVPLPREDRD